MLIKALFQDVSSEQGDATYNVSFSGYIYLSNVPLNLTEGFVFSFFIDVICTFSGISPQWSDHLRRHCPADTRRNDNVIITSKRCRDVVWRNNDVIITPCVHWASFWSGWRWTGERMDSDKHLIWLYIIILHLFAPSAKQTEWKNMWIGFKQQKVVIYDQFIIILWSNAASYNSADNDGKLFDAIRYSYTTCTVEPLYNTVHYRRY